MFLMEGLKSDRWTWSTRVFRTNAEGPKRSCHASPNGHKTKLQGAQWVDPCRKEPNTSKKTNQKRMLVNDPTALEKARTSMLVNTLSMTVVDFARSCESNSMLVKYDDAQRARVVNSQSSHCGKSN